ncbi:hypothetical protein KY336_00245 [Candidatus Woesearchaeota archaeon]|nr:hypothetical protein [Candidatus Woesearchaeota archaeon]
MAKTLNVQLYSPESAVKNLVEKSLERLLGTKGISVLRSDNWEAAMTKLCTKPADILIFGDSIRSPGEAMADISEAMGEISVTREFVNAIYICRSDDPVLQKEDGYTKYGLDGIIEVDSEITTEEDIDYRLSIELEKFKDWKELVKLILSEKGIVDPKFLGKDVVPFEERKLADGRTIKHIALVNIHFMNENEPHSIRVIRKYTQGDSYETEYRAYNYIFNSVPDAQKCFVRCYGALPLENAIVLEYWNTKNGNLGENTLENRLKHYYEEIKSAHERTHTSKVEKLELERLDELIDISRLLAHFHYFATKRVYDELHMTSKEEILEAEQCLLQDNSDCKMFELKRLSLYDCRDKFLRDVSRVLKYLNTKVKSDEKLTKSQLSCAMDELENILLENEVFFAWTQNGPFTVIANDIYGENLLINSEYNINNNNNNEAKDRKFQYRIVDPRHLSFGPAILDFGFQGSPYLGFEKLQKGEIDASSFAQRENLKRACFRKWFNEIKDLADEDPCAPRPLYEELSTYDTDILVRDDRTKEVYWNFKIAGDIIERDIDDTRDETEAQSALHTRLQFSDCTFKHLLECARPDYDSHQLKSLRKIYDFFDKNIFQKMGVLNGGETNRNC